MFVDISDKIYIVLALANNVLSVVTVEVSYFNDKMSMLGENMDK